MWIPRDPEDLSGWANLTVEEGERCWNLYKDEPPFVFTLKNSEEIDTEGRTLNFTEWWLGGAPLLRIYRPLVPGGPVQYYRAMGLMAAKEVSPV